MNIREVLIGIIASVFIYHCSTELWRCEDASKNKARYMAQDARSMHLMEGVTDLLEGPMDLISEIRKLQKPRIWATCSTTSWTGFKWDKSASQLMLFKIVRLCFPAFNFLFWHVSANFDSFRKDWSTELGLDSSFPSCIQMWFHSTSILQFYARLQR